MGHVFLYHFVDFSKSFSCPREVGRAFRKAYRKCFQANSPPGNLATLLARASQGPTVARECANATVNNGNVMDRQAGRQADRKNRQAVSSPCE
jgi:hypothetical protein